MLTSDLTLLDEEFIRIETSRNVGIQYPRSTLINCKFSFDLIPNSYVTGKYILPVHQLDSSLVSLLPFCAIYEKEKYSQTCIYINFSSYLDKYIHISSYLHQYIILLNKGGDILYITNNLSDLFRIDIGENIKSTVINFLCITKDDGTVVVEEEMYFSLNSRDYASFFTTFEKDYYFGVIVDNSTSEVKENNMWKAEREVTIEYTTDNPIVELSIPIIIKTQDVLVFDILSSNPLTQMDKETVTINPFVLQKEKEETKTSKVRELRSYETIYNIQIKCNFTDFKMNKESSLDSFSITLINRNDNSLYQNLQIDIKPKMIDCTIDDITYEMSRCSNNNRKTITFIYTNNTCRDGFSLPAQDYIPCFSTNITGFRIFNIIALVLYGVLIFIITLSSFVSTNLKTVRFGVHRFYLFIIGYSYLFSGIMKIIIYVNMSNYENNNECSNVCSIYGIVDCILKLMRLVAVYCILKVIIIEQVNKSILLHSHPYFYLKSFIIPLIPQVIFLAYRSFNYNIYINYNIQGIIVTECKCSPPEDRYLLTDVTPLYISIQIVIQLGTLYYNSVWKTIIQSFIGAILLLIQYFLLLLLMAYQIPKHDDYDFESFLDGSMLFFDMIIFLLLGRPRVADTIEPSEESDYNLIIIDPLKRLFFKKYLIENNSESGLIFYEAVKNFKHLYIKNNIEKNKQEAKRIINNHLIPGSKYEVIIEKSDKAKKVVQIAENDLISVDMFTDVSNIVIHDILLTDCPKYVDSSYAFQSGPFINWYNTFEKFDNDIKIALLEKIVDYCTNIRYIGSKDIEKVEQIIISTFDNNMSKSHSSGGYNSIGEIIFGNNNNSINSSRKGSLIHHNRASSLPTNVHNNNNNNNGNSNNKDCTDGKGRHKARRNSTPNMQYRNSENVSTSATTGIVTSNPANNNNPSTAAVNSSTTIMKKKNEQKGSDEEEVINSLTVKRKSIIAQNPRYTKQSSCACSSTEDSFDHFIGESTKPGQNQNNKLPSLRQDNLQPQQQESAPDSHLVPNQQRSSQSLKPFISQSRRGSGQNIQPQQQPPPSTYSPNSNLYTRHVQSLQNEEQAPPPCASPKNESVPKEFNVTKMNSINKLPPIENSRLPAIESIPFDVDAVLKNKNETKNKKK